MHSRSVAIAYAWVSLPLVTMTPFWQQLLVAEPPRSGRPPLLDAEDPRLLELKEEYENRVRELTEELIQNIETLGLVPAAPYLERSEKRQHLWAMRVSLGGLSNYSIQISPDDVEQTIPWRHSLEHPPLGPRAALVIADETIRDRFDPDTVTLKLQRISLVPLLPQQGRWYWEVQYEASKGSRRGEIAIAIRMDGKVMTHFKQ